MIVRVDEGVPDWIVAYMKQVAPRFGLGMAWVVHVSMKDKPNDNPHSMGSVWVNGAYFNADIEFRRDLPNDESGRNTVRHELWHIAMYQVDLMVDRILEMVPEEGRAVASRMYTDAVEQFVQTLTRANVE